MGTRTEASLRSESAAALGSVWGQQIIKAIACVFVAVVSAVETMIAVMQIKSKSKRLVIEVEPGARQTPQPTPIGTNGEKLFPKPLADDEPFCRPPLGESPLT